MAHIDYYFATLSPFTYLAGNRFEKVAAKHGATVSYKPLDIMSLFARTGGTPPKDRHPNRIAYRAQDLPRQAKKHGLPLNLQPAFWPTNPVPSSCAVIAAQEAGGGDLGKLVHALLRAVWAEDRNIAEDDVIKGALTEAGFDPSLNDMALVNFSEVYEKNLEDAVTSGAFGAPFYIVDGSAHFWGQDKIEELDLHLSGKL
ncbi:MAG: 2-hydroxychromene-2-carboxylate isomerase [Pseudomonadota bacterium]